jgi:outer membrane biosynthesis protein TonB
MIPRTLVPHGSRPPAADAAPTQRRRPTTLDERTLVPAMLPIVQLDGNSTIPKSLPLESIAARVVVPRDIGQEAYAPREENALPAQPTELDERIAIPQGAAPPETIEGPPAPPPADLVDLDVFMTGEVNLLAKPPAVDRDRWQLVTRISSFVFHALMVLFVLSLPKLFPPHALTQREIDRANSLLTWIPPESSYSPRPRPEPRVVPQPPVVRVDPKVLKDVAPSLPPPPKPEPVRPKAELPDAPAPKVATARTDPPPVAPKVETPKPTLKLDSVDMPTPHSSLKLPQTSTSPMDQAVRDLAQAPSAKSYSIGGGGRVQGRPGVSGGGQAYGGVQLLTPDQGVDFQPYLERVYIKVKQNWFAVMPESVELGERGVVILTFKIMRDGSVPGTEPIIEQNSGKQPLDRAASSSVRTSNPFEPLPSQFTGPYIELRFGYFYNIDPNQYYRQK